MEKKREGGLVELVKRGGVFYEIPGTAPREVIAALIEAAGLPPAVDRKCFLEAALEREALMPTSLGHGIALPHPRNPPLIDVHEQMVALGFLKQPVDWRALDGEPVHTALLIVSASAKLHLHTLSEINFFCQQEDFRALLANRASPEDIIKVIEDAEADWR
ncbi:MAG: PTS sugar transporter subunit IIA [Treponema sp.]|jgi:PTS system nitrogen regulatory IIA component|nr:PTS sugar transporter subunit IIA [Treponema sp.]